MSEFRGTIELGALCLKCSERIFTAADIKFVIGSKDAELATFRTQLSEALDKIEGLDSDLSHSRERNKELEAERDAMRGVVEAARRVDACEDPEAEETAHAFDDLRKRLVAHAALTKTEG